MTETRRLRALIEQWKLEAAEIHREAYGANPGQYVSQKVHTVDGRRLLKCAAQLSALLSEPQAAQPHPADMDLPDEVIQNGVNLRVIRQAYDWTIDVDGNIAGLTAGDQGFENTGIKISHEDCDGFADREWVEKHRTPAPPPVLPAPPEGEKP